MWTEQLATHVGGSVVRASLEILLAVIRKPDKGKRRGKRYLGEQRKRKRSRSPLKPKKS